VTLVTNDCGLAGWCNPGMLRACCDAKKEETLQKQIAAT
jgi:hypothetical protein